MPDLKAWLVENCSVELPAVVEHSPVVKVEEALVELQLDLVAPCLELVALGRLAEEQALHTLVVYPKLTQTLYNQ